MTDTDPTAPEPPDELADLDPAGQVEITEATDNGLAEEDAELAQPEGAPVPLPKGTELAEGSAAPAEEPTGG